MLESFHKSGPGYAWSGWKYRRYTARLKTRKIIVAGTINNVAETGADCWVRGCGDAIMDRWTQARSSSTGEATVDKESQVDFNPFTKSKGGTRSLLRDDRWKLDTLTNEETQSAVKRLLHIHSVRCRSDYFHKK